MSGALVFADAQVGRELGFWLLDHYAGDIGLLVTTGQNDLYTEAKKRSVDVVVYKEDQDIADHVRDRGIEPDIGYLIWWPRIVRDELLDLPKYGFINTHPSLLPHNRGKHYNFWSIVEEAPFGVSLHFIDAGVDTGDIVAQQPLEYGWTENGGDLYHKAQRAIVELFKEQYPQLRNHEWTRKPQDLSQGSMHRAAELDEASRIDLDRQYTARELLNLLRARTFEGYPACKFNDNGTWYEVRVSIREMPNDKE